MSKQANAFTPKQFTEIITRGHADAEFNGAVLKPEHFAHGALIRFYAGASAARKYASLRLCGIATEPAFRHCFGEWFFGHPQALLSAAREYELRCDRFEEDCAVVEQLLGTEFLHDAWAKADESPSVRLQALCVLIQQREIFHAASQPKLAGASVSDGASPHAIRKLLNEIRNEEAERDKATWRHTY